MKMNIELDEDDPTQVTDQLVRIMAVALKLGVNVDKSEDSLCVTNPGSEERMRRWIGPDGEFRRDVLERQWVVKESLDPVGKPLTAPAATK